MPIFTPTAIDDNALDIYKIFNHVNEEFKQQ